MSASSSRGNPQDAPSTSGSGGARPGGLFGSAGRRAAKQAEQARFAMPAEEYLRRSHIDVYLKDMIKLLLLTGADARPIEFAAAYLEGVLTGEHVAGREFAFVEKTPHNRRAFLCLCTRALSQVKGLLVVAETEVAGGRAPADGGGGEGGLTLQDCHGLVQMLCPDFPLRLAQAAFRAATAPVVGPGGAGRGGRAGFPSFLEALDTAFYYEAFLASVKDRVFEGHRFRTVPAKAARHALVKLMSSADPVLMSVPPAKGVWGALAAASQAAGEPSSDGMLSMEDFVRELCFDPSVRAGARADAAAAEAAMAAAAAAARAGAQRRVQAREGGESGGGEKGKGGGGSKKEKKKVVARKSSLKGAPSGRVEREGST